MHCLFTDAEKIAPCKSSIVTNVSNVARRSDEKLFTVEICA